MDSLGFAAYVEHGYSISEIVGGGSTSIPLSNITVNPTMIDFRNPTRTVANDLSIGFNTIVIDTNYGKPIKAANFVLSFYCGM